MAEDSIKEIIQKLSKYESINDIPEQEIKDIRSLLLRNEIMLRKELFQSVGFNLSKLEMNTNDQDHIDYFRYGDGSLDLNPFSGSMKEEGTFKEAVVAANKKLILFGFQPYVIKKEDSDL